MSNSYWNILNKKTPEGVSLLEIPGAGDPIDFLKQLMEREAPLQNTPTQQIAGMSANEQTTQNLLAKYLSGSGDVTQSD